MRIKVAKNKLAPPMRTALVDVEFGRGISRGGELFELGLACGALTKNGSFYSRGDLKLGQGRENVKALFESDPPLAIEIEKEILAHAAEGGGVAIEGGEEEE